MAKLKPSLIKISGKFGDNVIVDSPRYGHLIRKKSAPGSKKEEAALKQQYSRTKFLNTLASELNTTLRMYSGNLK